MTIRPSHYGPNTYFIDVSYRGEHKDVVVRQNTTTGAFSGNYKDGTYPYFIAFTAKDGVVAGALTDPGGKMNFTLMRAN